MALINCSECGKEISDKSDICIGCGFPIKIHLEEIEKEIKTKEITKKQCKFCGSENIDIDGYCDDCGMKTETKEIIKSEEIEEIKEVEGIYSICPECNFHNKPGLYKCSKCGHKYKLSEYEVIDARERLCPCCKSKRIRAFTEEKVLIPRKTKTQTSINLNPFKPFTIFNQKEKVVRNEVTIKETKFICDNCGNIWS